MGICNRCKKDMYKVDSCIRASMVHDGVKYEPIKYGEDGKHLGLYYRVIERCSECGAKIGHYHHLGCSNEVCPVCEGQLLSCGCISRQYNPPIFDIKTFRKYVMTKENKKVVKEETMVNSINSEISVQIKPESWILMEKRNNKALLFDKENHKYIICYGYRELDNAMIRYNSYILFDEITESISDLYSIGKDEMPETIKKRLREIHNSHQNIDKALEELEIFLGIYGIEYGYLLKEGKELSKILLGDSHNIEEDIHSVEKLYLKYKKDL